MQNILKITFTIIKFLIASLLAIIMIGAVILFILRILVGV
jgi:hypothetical protein